MNSRRLLHSVVLDISYREAKGGLGRTQYLSAIFTSSAPTNFIGCYVIFRLTKIVFICNNDGRYIFQKFWKTIEIVVSYSKLCTRESSIGVV